MVREAEQFIDEDKGNKAMVTEFNRLESMAYGIKNQLAICILPSTSIHLYPFLVTSLVNNFLRGKARHPRGFVGTAT